MRTAPADDRTAGQPVLPGGAATTGRGRSRHPAAWAGAAAACLFALLTWQVLARGVVTRWDVAARRQVQDWVFEPGLADLRSAAGVLRNLGDPWFAGTCCLLLAGWAAWRCRRPGPLVRAAAALVVLGAVVWPMKVAIGRPGPGMPDVRPDWYGYFPSGHTASAAICYGAAALAVAGAAPRLRRVAFGCLGVLVLVEAWALIWYDDHWVSDVVGGAAFAVVCLAVTFGVRAPQHRAARAAGGDGEMGRAGVDARRPSAVPEAPRKHQGRP